jgi:hypothetical protein
LIACAHAQYSIAPFGPDGKADWTARFRRARSASVIAAMILVVGA